MQMNIGAMDISFEQSLRLLEGAAQLISSSPTITENSFILNSCEKAKISIRILHIIPLFLALLEVIAQTLLHTISLLFTLVLYNLAANTTLGTVLGLY
jgi:hypothetical protein